MAGEGTPATPAAAPAAPAPTKALNFNQIEGAMDHPPSAMEESAPPKKGPKPGRKTPEVEDSDFEEVIDDEESEDEIEGSEAGDAEDGDSELDEDDDSEPGEDEEDGEDSWEAIKKEFDEEGRLTINVNGKARKFNLEQLKTIAASGAHTMEVRQKLQGDIQRVQKQKEELQRADAAISPAYKAIKEKKMQDALLELAGAAGQSRLDVRRQLRDEFVPVVADWLGISREWVNQRLQEPAVRQHHEFLKTKEENEYYKAEAERAAKAKEEAAKKGQVSPGIAKMRQLQTEHGIPDLAIREAVTLLKEAGEITGKEPDFPVDMVVNKLLDIRAVDRAIEAIEAVKPRMLKNDKFLDSIIETVKKNPEIGQGKLVKFIRKHADEFSTKEKQQEADELTKEVSRKSLKNRDKSQHRTPKQQGQTKSGALSFRDYERELEGGLP